MRKITIGQIACFFALLVVIVTLGLLTNQIAVGWIPLGDFRGVTMTAAAIFFIYLYAFLVYRLFLTCMPLKEGEIVEGSREEFSAQVNILFYLLLFNSLIRTNFFPVPLQRLIYLALGARLGDNTFSAGAILDPPLTKVGSNTIIGHDAVLFSHVIEGSRFALAGIDIGNNVTIGAKAVIMSGVTIENDAIVSAGAVVTTGTHIGSGEIWGKIPARLLKRKQANEPEDSRDVINRSE